MQLSSIEDLKRSFLSFHQLKWFLIQLNGYGYNKALYGLSESIISIEGDFKAEKRIFLKKGLKRPFFWYPQTRLFLIQLNGYRWETASKGLFVGYLLIIMHFKCEKVNFLCIKALKDVFSDTCRQDIFNAIEWISIWEGSQRPFCELTFLCRVSLNNENEFFVKRAFEKDGWDTYLGCSGTR